MNYESSEFSKMKQLEFLYTQKKLHCTAWFLTNQREERYTDANARQVEEKKTRIVKC